MNPPPRDGLEFAAEGRIDVLELQAYLDTVERGVTSNEQANTVDLVGQQKGSGQVTLAGVHRVHRVG